MLIAPSACYENLPMAIVEAYARGVPVVATRVGGLPEIVEDSQQGWLVPPGDSDELARAVTRAWNDVRSTNAAGNAARRAYELRYSAAAQLDQLLAVYERARRYASSRS